MTEQSWLQGQKGEILYLQMQEQSRENEIEAEGALNSQINHTNILPSLLFHFLNLFKWYHKVGSKVEMSQPSVYTVIQSSLQTRLFCWAHSYGFI